MSIIDKKFFERKRYYIFQSLLAALAVFGVLLCLGSVAETALLGAIGASSLGATAFIAFSAKDAFMARPRNMIGGYIIGLSVGALAYHLTPFLDSVNHTGFLATDIMASLAVGVAMFLMVLFDVEHPPAAGLALGLVLESWGLTTVLVIFGAIITLSIIRKIIKPLLINLI